jgi:hypothetical protein
MIKTFEKYVKSNRTFKDSLNHLFVFKFNDCHSPEDGKFCSDGGSDSNSSAGSSKENKNPNTSSNKETQLIRRGLEKVKNLYPFEKSWDYESSKRFLDDQLTHEREELKVVEQKLKTGTDKEKKEAEYEIKYINRSMEREEQRLKDKENEYYKRLEEVVNGRELSIEIVPIKNGTDAISIFTSLEFMGIPTKSNTILSGKDEWIGKTIEEVPEVQKLINETYNYLTENKYEIGSFKKAIPNEEETDSLASMMQYYKGPMPSDPKPLRIMATAYYKGEISTSDIKMQSEWQSRQNSIKQEIKEIRNLVNKEGHEKELENWEIKLINQYEKELIEGEWSQKIHDININMKKVQFYSQETIDSFLGQIQETKRILEDRAINGKIKLYRGIQGEYANQIKESLKKDNDLEIPVYSVTSWTSDLDVAEKFANKKGVVLVKEIPVEDILLNHETTPYLRTSDFLFGGDEEYEYIVGSKDGILKINKNEVQLKRRE